MNTPTEDQLKLALAGELPDCINICSSPHTCQWFEWSNQEEVTEQEWPYIMAEVEKKLGDNTPVDFKDDRYRSQQNLFQCILMALVSNVEAGEWYVPALGLTMHHLTLASQAPWQTRAIAYFKTIGREVV